MSSEESGNRVNDTLGNFPNLIVRSHTARITLQRLEHLEWDAMPQLQYSPGIASSWYHLCDILQNPLGRKVGTLLAYYLTHSENRPGGPWYRNDRKEY